MIISGKVDIDIDFKDFNIDNVVERELKELATDIEKEAKRNTPVLTGHLRNSIESEVDGLEANIGTDCYYAPFVHDGTYKMAARPFLDMAAESILDGFEDKLVDEIVRLL